MYFVSTLACRRNFFFLLENSRIFGCSVMVFGVHSSIYTSLIIRVSRFRLPLMQLPFSILLGRKPSRKIDGPYGNVPGRSTQFWVQLWNLFVQLYERYVSFYTDIYPSTYTRSPFRQDCTHSRALRLGYSSVRRLFCSRLYCSRQSERKWRKCNVPSRSKFSQDPTQLCQTSTPRVFQWLHPFNDNSDINVAFELPRIYRSVHRLYLLV